MALSAIRVMAHPLLPEALPERSLLVQYHNCRLATPKGLVKGELWTQRGRSQPLLAVRRMG